MTDHVISNNLVVLGMSTFTGGQTFDGQAIVDIDNTEALLVRKDGDAGDVFIVDTTNSIVRIGSGLATAGDGLDLEALVLTGDGTRDSHSILFTQQSFGESSLTERDWKMFASAADTRLNIDFQTNSGGYDNIFSLNTIGGLFLGLGINAGPASTGLLLSRAPRTTDGNDNSTTLELQGRSFETATPHVITWRQQVNLLDNLGDSQYEWSSAVDGSFGTRMTLSDGSAVLTVGSIVAEANPSTFDAIIVDVTAVEAFIVRENADAGDVFIVNTSTPSATLPHANSFISLGPNASATGDIRFGNTRFIAWRNMNNNGDVQALSVDEDDFLNIGSAAALKTRILSPSFLALGASGHAFGAAAINSVLTIDTTSTADGGGTTAFAVNFFPDYTGASGLTEAIALMNLGGNIQTQITDTITNVSTLVVADPSIGVGAGATVTNAQSLLISGAPTEGTNNYALRVQSGDVLFSDLQLAVGVSSLAGIFQIEFGGNFLSDGGNVFATNFRVSPGLIGAAGDTDSLITARFEGNITTQTATESIANIAQVRIADGIITDNLTGGGLITNAQILLLEGTPIEGVNNYSLRSLGAAPSLFAGVQFVIGTTTVLDRWQVNISGAFISGGSSNESAKLRIEGSVTGADGDTAGMVGTYFDATFVTQTAVENIADISQCRFDGANITDNLTGDITNAQTLFITASPTAGENNWTIRSTALAPSIFQGGQFAIGRTTLEDWHQFVISGGFVSGGSATEADMFKIESTLIGAPGDSTLIGAFFAANITTQTATETIADIAQVKIFEPTITDNLTGDITRAQTLLLNGSPTEGLTNFALRSTGPARSMFVGLPFTIGTNIATDVWQVQIRGNFTSGGTSNRAAKFEIEESVIGVSGDTVFLGGALFAARVTTQTVAEVVTDVFQVRIEEPIITVGAGSSITNAQSLLIVAAPTEGVNNYALRVAAGDVILGGNLAVSGVGPHSIAGVTFGAVQLLIGSTFTSDGASDIAAGLFHTPAIVGAPGDTSALTGTTLTAGITTQTATESIANIAQLQVNEPAITDNLTGDITLASTVLITGAPTEGLANYALRVVSGATFLGGELEHAGSTLGFFGTSPTTQPAAYTRNAVVVEDRTLLASASATTLNNNNVLAALIADLQSLGVIG